ncbi:hypothetical protein GBF38_015569 [Nibea albiflora]|uniref:Uncharacterized protein n=1 Tax=Nibea albiflora TaxID=240163 RepID=A0ACB7EL67_NIBAL|nr:hypothetical protein GBF38_015569 [Nibea albiflora]
MENQLLQKELDKITTVHRGSMRSIRLVTNIRQQADTFHCDLNKEVYLEFNRVLGRNLKEEFVGVLDGLCPSLMEIFKRKTGRIGKQLADLVQQTTVG